MVREESLERRAPSLASVAHHPPQPAILADGVAEACLRLGISIPTFYREVKAGRLVAVKAGRRTLCTREAQAAWLASLPRV